MDANRDVKITSDEFLKFRQKGQTMRKITSLSLGLSFLIMTYTGIMLFLCPHGRVAYWSDWHFLGLSKNQYGDIHTTSMITMLFFGILHIYYNWKPIVSYMKDKTKKISFTKKEFLIALGINIFFVVGTLTYMQPFKAFLNFEENLKDSWSVKYNEPPYGHAELTKLKVLCRKMNINLEEAKTKLNKKKIVFNENDTLLVIAKKNNLSPSDIFNIIKTDFNSQNKTNKNVPANLGKKTLKELNQLGVINLEKSLKILKVKGLKDITKNSRIKDIADELNSTPYEVYETLIAK